VDLTSTSNTYAAPTTGTAASNSITVVGTHSVLVTLTVTCTNSVSNDGCYMSFTASGGLTQAASDSFAVGTQRVNNTPGLAGSASYLVTVTGNTTFTAQYKTSTALGGTATFLASKIIVQIF